MAGIYSVIAHVPSSILEADSGATLALTGYGGRCIIVARRKRELIKQELRYRHRRPYAFKIEDALIPLAASIFGSLGQNMILKSDTL